jgi:hypothetical protein
VKSGKPRQNGKEELRKAQKYKNSQTQEEKVARPTKCVKSGKPSQNGKEELRKAQKHKNSQTQKLSLNQLPLTLSMQALPLDKYYHVSSLNHPVSKEFNQLYAHALHL